jgi:RNA polymerase sigma-70 factor (ECF subfamily)
MVSTLRRRAGSHRVRSEAIDTDAAAIAAAIVDPRAFTPLYLRYVDPIYRYCHRRLGSREEAEDATSLVFTKALTDLPSYRAESSTFRSWLFAIAHNTVADEWRHRRPTVTVDESVELVDSRPTPEAVAMDDESGRRVRSLLARLPGEQADVVELRLAGLSGPEIARALGRSPNTVKVTQYRAYSRLRVLLGKEADDATRR